MLNFKKLFFGLLFSVLFSAVLIAVCAFMILKLSFLPSEPILGTAAAVIGGVSVFASAFLAARLAGGKRLAARPCAWHALCSFLCCDKRYAVCKYAGCASCYTERNICNMQHMRWSNGCE